MLRAMRREPLFGEIVAFGQDDVVKHYWRIVNFGPDWMNGMGCFFFGGLLARTLARVDPVLVADVQAGKLRRIDEARVARAAENSERL